MSMTSEPESDDVTKNDTMTPIVSALTAVSTSAGRCSPTATGNRSRNTNSEVLTSACTASMSPPGPLSSMYSAELPNTASHAIVISSRRTVRRR